MSTANREAIAKVADGIEKAYLFALSKSEPGSEAEQVCLALAAALAALSAAPADEVCDRCFEVSDKALELVGIAENADFEEGCGAVFELRQLLPNLDKYIRWEVSDEVAKYCPACSGQHTALIHVECQRCEKHCPCKAAPQSAQPTQQPTAACEECIQKYKLQVNGDLYRGSETCCKCGGKAWFSVAAERSTGSPAAEER